MARKKTIAASLVALSVLLVAIVLHHKPVHHAEAPRKYMVTSTWRTNEDMTQQFVGQIRAIQHIELRALEKGYLNEIYVDEGQALKKGQPMFRTMPMLNEAEFKKASAESDLARIEYQNTLSLAKGNVVSPNELSLARARFEKAKATRQLAKVHLDLTEIKAPFDGMMGRFHVRRGSLVEEGELLTTLSDNSNMWVYFNVSEAQYLDFRAQSNGPNQTNVQLLMANGKLYDLPGRVETIEADFNNETGNIAFRATFPNPKGILRHGETGNVRMTIPVKNALVIPQQATFDVLDKKFVYVVDDKSMLKAREVTIAEELPHLYLIASGLKEGERILIEGLGRVRDNDKIEANYVEPAKAIAGLDLPAQ